MNRYLGKTAVITGGNSGIGLASAVRLKQEGARVVVVGRDATTVQRALPHLKEGASIILNSSTVTAKGWPGIAVYSATKAAVRSLARTFAAELLPRGIRVNAISPGVTFTPIFGRLGLDKEQLDATAAALLKMIPAGRLASAEDIAAGVAYLGSSDAAYVVGAELTIDGGLGQI